MTRVLSLLVFLLIPLAPAFAQNGNEEALGAEARRLTGEELLSAFEGRRVDGMYYDDDYRQWYFFNEDYKADGEITGEGGPSHDRNKWWWRGNWSVENDQICLDYPNGGDSYCREVWLEGDIYKLTTADQRVTEWHRLTD